MVSIWNYRNYKGYVQDWISNRPKAGRGQLQAMAKFLGVHSTMMSHVFTGNKELSEEHACRLCQFLGLNEEESDYFILLVQFERAGSHDLKTLLNKRVERKVKEFGQVKKQISNTKSLDDAAKAIFYSSWHYSGIRLMAGLKQTDTIDKLQERTGLSRGKIQEILTFLIQQGIIKQSPEGGLAPGYTKTHISQDSPFVWKHHQNWRIKAMERYQQIDHEKELFFTSPLTISEEDIPIVKRQILSAIKEVMSIVEKSPSERLCCLNIDWVSL
jgi:uncharacterized protein (TIGR02147 family)